MDLDLKNYQKSIKQGKTEKNSSKCSLESNNLSEDEK